MAGTSSGSSKGKMIEEIYQKKSQLEHILLRPDSYIGSIEKETKVMWVWDVDATGKGKMVNRTITYVPGLYKIFDEILVNAADNKQRDKKMSVLRVNINAEKNEIVIYNNGKGIPVTMHKEEKMYVPTMIFGHLLTSSNYNDDEKKVVGGRNGYGAKLCNIFSKEFKVETSSKEYKKAFSQVWSDNMSKAHEAKVSNASDEDFTQVTFQPDLEKFKMEKLDKDIVALFSRRAFDVAATSKGVKVFLNGDRLPVACFKDYVNLFLNKVDEDEEPIKIAHEVVNDRWEVAVANSEKGYQQISFVNSIATTRGGKHVDHFVDKVVAYLTEAAKKKLSKQAAALQTHNVKNHIWVFVNCLIENPTFDSQTKETMTLQAKNFGSKCSVSDKFLKSLGGIGVVESICEFAMFKAEKDMKKKDGKKTVRLTGIDKLIEANEAGRKDALKCTLILTEGDSAKTLVVAGLSVVGRDRYGVFPLRGKLLNVREATHKQIMENTEITNIIKILGLQFKKVYEKPEDLKTLRYGKLMIMTDQDQDGSHIKGLLINFIHHFWPSLLKLDFLEEFITPIVKVTKKSGSKIVKAFYSLPEFEEWKKGTAKWNTAWNVKYYKGLGTSTSEEAKEYFSDLERHRIVFRYNGPDDDHHVRLAFSKKMIEQRKEWLTSSMEERKRRRELGLPEQYLYEKNTQSVTYQDFVNRELVLFSNMDNERSIPSLVDGLKPGQRKVMFTCFRRNDKKEVKVAQLAGSVGEKSAYHHGEQSLMTTIIGMAQDFVGSNNINLLLPNGMFGTRLTGGKDAASPRYIFTMLSPVTRKLFPPKDDPLMKYLYDDNLRIEPEYYVPIIPMVMVNGAEGIGTGWSTKIPNFDPRVLARNVKHRLRGEPLEPMLPWYKGFKGTITPVESNKFVISGEAVMRSSTSFDITELPVQKWTQPYRDQVLEPMLSPQKGQTSALVTDVRSYFDDVNVHFIIEMSEENLRNAAAEGIHKVFKLQTTMTTTSMVLFDANGCLKRYDTPEEIFNEFFPVRMKFYEERKRYYEGLLQAEARYLDNQVRFIREKNEGLIKMEKVKEHVLTKKLIERNYDSDPVKAWRQEHCKGDDEEKEVENDPAAEEEDAEEDDGKESKTVYDFNYLYCLHMRHMLVEHAEKLSATRDAKHAELAILQQTSPAQLWESDIDDFLKALDEVEQKQEKELEERQKKKEKEAEKLKKLAGKVKTTTKKAAAAANVPLLTAAADGVKPATGGRIEPTIDMEKYQPKEKKERKKVDNTEKANKRKREEKEEEKENKDDAKQPKITQMLTGTAALLSLSPPKYDDKNTDKENLAKPIDKPTTQKMKLKQTTLNFKPINAPVASTSNKPAPLKEIIQLESDSEDVKPTKVVKKPMVKKTITKTKKRTSSDFESDDDDDDDDSIILKTKKTTKKQRNVVSDSSDDDDTLPSSQSTVASKSSDRPVRGVKKVNYKAILSSSDESDSSDSKDNSTLNIESDDLLDD